MADPLHEMVPGSGMSWFQTFALGVGALISTGGLRNATWWQGVVSTATSFSSGVFLIPFPAEYFGWTASGTTAAALLWGIGGSHCLAAYMKQVGILSAAPSPIDVVLEWWTRFRGR